MPPFLMLFYFDFLAVSKITYKGKYIIARINKTMLPPAD